MDCLTDVQDNERGETLDCFGVYPHALSIAYDWILSKQTPGLSLSHIERVDERGGEMGVI